MSSTIKIEDAEAERKLYRVDLPGAENDLYSLTELRELALKQEISPGTLISKEGQNDQAPASSIPTIYSTRNRRVAAGYKLVTGTAIDKERRPPLT